MSDFACCRLIEDAWVLIECFEFELILLVVDYMGQTGVRETMRIFERLDICICKPLFSGKIGNTTASFSVVSKIYGYYDPKIHYLSNIKQFIVECRVRSQMITKHMN